MRILNLFLLTLLYFGSTAQTQIGSDLDGEFSGDNFGSSVSLSANAQIVAVGAKRNDGTAYEAGHVRVYEQSYTGAWSQMGSDIDGEAYGDNSGYSISLSSDSLFLAIGAPGNNGNGSNSGHVRVYKYSSGSWIQVGSDINGEASSDESGFSTALSSNGTILAIGTPYNDGNGNDAGHVRVYEYSSGSWSQLGADIDGEAIADWSGYSISLSADGYSLAVGSPLNDGNGSNSGHVRVYKYSSGSWTQLGSDIDGEASGDQSGYSVSISSDGTKLAIGAPYNDGTGSDAGHVRVYEYMTGVWTQLGSDIDGEALGDISGFFVTLSSDGNVLGIGAPQNDGNGTDAGHVRLYEMISGSWTQLGTDIDGEALNDGSGVSIALSFNGSNSVIGASGNDGNGSNSGHVRVYANPICQDSIQQQPQSNTFYTVPGGANFTVAHSDTSATYQWQQNGGTGWSNLSDLGVYSGTSTDSLILTGITSSLNNFEFRCVINSCNIDTSNVATLTIEDNMFIDELLSKVNIYPNPTSGILSIILTSLSEYEVFNINGHKVAQGNTEGQIDITNLPTGSYQIIITNDDGRSTQTIQKI